MRRFDWTAADAAGARTSGRADARDELDLDRALERRGLVLLDARVVDERDEVARGRMSASELAALTAQLATIVAAGVPIAEGIAGLAERQPGRAQQLVVQGLAHELRAGASLSSALDRRPELFPSEYRAAVRAGEKSGALAKVLEGLAAHLESKQRLRESALQALIHPAILAVALTVLVLVLVCFLLPRVSVLYAGGVRSLPAQTRALLAVSSFLRDNATVLAALACACGVLVARSWKSERWRVAAHARLFALPRVGPLLRSIAAARFASTAAVLHGAGCDALTLLSVSGEASGNAAFRAAVVRAEARVARGALFSEALAEEPVVDRLIVQVMSVGERSGELAPALARVARRYEEDVPRELRRFLAFLEPALLAASGVVVAWILLAALLPIFELYEHLA